MAARMLTVFLCSDVITILCENKPALLSAAVTIKQKFKTDFLFCDYKYRFFKLLPFLTFFFCKIPWRLRRRRDIGSFKMSSAVCLVESWTKNRVFVFKYLVIHYNIFKCTFMVTILSKG